MLPVAVAIFAASIISAPLLARRQPAVTADDYARAERFLAPAVTPLASGGSVAATWLPDDRFWYRNALPTGAEFIVVDPVKKTRTRAFDHAKLAAALSTAAGATFDELGLPFQTMDLSPDSAAVSFNLAAKRWSCDVQGSKCATTGDAMVPARRLRPYAADADVAPREDQHPATANHSPSRRMRSAESSSATGTSG